MKSLAQSPSEYIKSLPADRAKIVRAIRGVIKKNLDKGFKETMQYGMISYVVPTSLYPKGYLGKKDVPLPFISLGSQKNYVALHLMAVYGNKELNDWFVAAYKKTGKKLTMGKACVNLPKYDDVAFGVIGACVRKCKLKNYVSQYDRLRGNKK